MHIFMRRRFGHRKGWDSKFFLCQPVTQGVGRGGGTIVDADAREDRREVIGDGALAHDERRRRVARILRLL